MVRKVLYIPWMIRTLSTAAPATTKKTSTESQVRQTRKNSVMASSMLSTVLAKTIWHKITRLKTLTLRCKFPEAQTPYLKIWTTWTVAVASTADWAPSTKKDSFLKIIFWAVLLRDSSRISSANHRSLKAKTCWPCSTPENSATSPSWLKANRFLRTKSFWHLVPTISRLSSPTTSQRKISESLISTTAESRTSNFTNSWDTSTPTTSRSRANILMIYSHWPIGMTFNRSKRSVSKSMPSTSTLTRSARFSTLLIHLTVRGLRIPVFCLRKRITKRLLRRQVSNTLKRTKCCKSLEWEKRRKWIGLLDLIAETRISLERRAICKTEFWPNWRALRKFKKTKLRFKNKL